MPGPRHTGPLLVLCVCAAAAFSWWSSRSVEPPRSDVRVTVADTSRARIGDGDTRVGITRDGSAIVYGGERVDAAGVTHETLMLRRVATAVDAPLFTAPAGTQARSPFFSYDGTEVGFIDRGRLMRVPAAGGEAQELCECSAAPAVRAVWLQDGSLIYQANHRLRLLTPDRRRHDLTRINSAAGEREHVAPTVLADQQTVLYTVLSAGDATAVRSVHLRTGKESVVLPGGMAAQYAGDGHVAYVDEAFRLRVIDLNPATLAADRMVPVAPVQVAANRRGDAGWAVSEAGTLVHAPGMSVPDATAARPGDRMLTWVARDGRRQASGMPPGRYSLARVAPTGDAVAIEVRDETVNVWVWDLRTNRLAPLTTGPRNAFPEWLPDGQAMLIGSLSGATRIISRVARDGNAPPTRVPVSLPMEGPLSISARGPLAVFRSEWPGTHLRAMSPNGGVVTTVTNGKEREQGASLSPDGMWLAYDATPRDAVASADSVSEVFVRPFPNSTTARQLSVGGGRRPLWSRDGREIFYLDARNHLMRVDVSHGEPPEFGTPVPFFDDVTTTDDWFVALGRRTFDLAPDGSRFIAITSRIEPAPQGPADLVVSTGWLQHVHWPWMQLWSALS